MSSALQTGLFSGGPLGLFWGWNVGFDYYHIYTLTQAETIFQDMQSVHVTRCVESGRDLQHIPHIGRFVLLGL